MNTYSVGHWKRYVTKATISLLVAAAAAAAACNDTVDIGPLFGTGYSINVAPENANLAPGDTLRVIATATYSVNGVVSEPPEPIVVVWSSTNENVATVDSAGLVRAIGRGLASIVASVAAATGVSDGTSVTVN